MQTKAKKKVVVNDFKDFKVVECFGTKPFTGADPVLLELIRKAAKK